MRPRLCLLLAWSVLLGALAIGNPWLPASPVAASAPTILPGEAARGSAPAGREPDGGALQTPPPRAAAEDAVGTGSSEPDEPVTPAASEAAEPNPESLPSTGN